MAGFTEIFTRSVIEPSSFSYVAYTVSSNLTLTWPFEADPTISVAAQIIDVTASAAGLSIYLPDASLVSVGQGILIRNVGGNTFTVVDAVGNTVVSIASGTAWFVWVTNNSTPQGSWASVQFGAGTSTANAASLAGSGLKAVGTLLNQNLIIQPKLSNYTLLPSDRSTVVQSLGGALTFMFTAPGPASNQLPNGWFVYIINDGTGTLTLTPVAGTIDGQSSKNLAPTESAIFFSDGTNIWSLGYGRSIVSTVTATNIAVPGSGLLTLSSGQVAAQIQNFTGTMVGNVTVEYGAGPGFWFVHNNTAGPFSVTFRVNGSDPGVVIPQGAFSILRSDGSNMTVAFTATSGTVTQINTTADLTGGPITTIGTLGLSDSSVTPGTVGGAGPPAVVPIVDVDQKGRIQSLTSYTLGTAASVNTGTTSGTIPVLGADNNVNPLNGGVPVGTVLDYVASSAPAGYVLAFGTIGNAGSGASNRANADQINLFTLLWNNWADAQAPVSGGRGASAAADFAALKTIAVPDLRGRVVAGLDNMGGSAAGRLSSASMSPDATTMGAVGGIETKALASGSTSGLLSISGSTSDVAGIVIHVPGTFQGNFGGGGSNVFGVPSFGINVSPFSGTLGVSGTAGGSLTVSGNTVVVQPAILMSKIIKY